jgi:hypothetical protein
MRLLWVFLGLASLSVGAGLVGVFVVSDQKPRQSSLLFKSAVIMGNDPSRALQAVNARKDVQQQLGLEKDEATTKRSSDAQQQRSEEKRRAQELAQQERLVEFNTKQQERNKRKEKLKEKWTASRRATSGDDEWTKLLRSENMHIRNLLSKDQLQHGIQ